MFRDRRHSVPFLLVFILLQKKYPTFAIQHANHGYTRTYWVAGSRLLAFRICSESLPKNYCGFNQLFNAKPHWFNPPPLQCIYEWSFSLCSSELCVGRILSFQADSNEIKDVMDGTVRSHIKIGAEVEVVQKHHQRSGERTHGVVKKILTKSPNHPHGIKVMLENGIVGRVKKIS